VRLNLGSGGRRLDDYTNIDIKPQFVPDIVADINNLPFPDDIAHIIRMDAVYEHIYGHRRADALREWYRVLRPGGKLVINWIPDFEALLGLYGGAGPCEEFPQFDIEMAKRMLYGIARDEHSLHKDVFSTDKVYSELMEAGFTGIYIVHPIAPGENLSYNISVSAAKPQCLSG